MTGFSHDYWDSPLFTSEQDGHDGSSRPILQDEVAIVTSGGKGIGRGISLRLAAAGAAIVIVGSGNMDMAHATAEEIRARGGRAEAVQADLALAESPQKVMDFAIARGKPVLDGKLVTLLQLIRESQSVRDACSRMQISYSTAWNLLNSAEDSLGYPLILRNKGGPSGSGSLLTEKGSALLAASEGFEIAARENLEKLYNTYFRDII